MALILLIVLLIGSCKEEKVTTQEENYTVIKVNAYTVTVEDLIPEIKTFGTISYKSKVDILPKTAGRIEYQYVEAGERVNKGDTLAMLEQFQLKLELKQSQAELDAAKSSYELTLAKYHDSLRGVEKQFLAIENARAELDDKKNSFNNIEQTLKNKETLLAEGAVSEESIRNLRTQHHSAYIQMMLAERNLKMQEIGFRDKDIIDNGFDVPLEDEDKIDIIKKLNTRIMEKEVEVAESRVKVAQTKLDSIKSYLKETYVKSPISGIVAARYMERGEQAKPDTKMFTIMNTGEVYAKINVSESDLGRVKPGGRVEISVDALGMKKLTGTIELISPIIDTKTRTVEISAAFSNTSKELIPGMFVRAKIKSNEKRKAIFIPATCLMSVEKDMAEVFVIRKNIVFKKQVKLGPELDDNIEIISGLKQDDRIVDNPPIDLIEGSRVEVTE